MQKRVKLLTSSVEHSPAWLAGHIAHICAISPASSRELSSSCQRAKADISVLPGYRVKEPRQDLEESQNARTVDEDRYSYSVNAGVPRGDGRTVSDPALVAVISWIHQGMMTSRLLQSDD